MNGKIRWFPSEKIKWKGEIPENNKLKLERKEETQNPSWHLINAHGSLINSVLWKLRFKIKEMSNLVYKTWHDHKNLLIYLLIAYPLYNLIVIFCKSLILPKHPIL